MSYKFGTDYYPEHWDSSRLGKDIALMKELGIDLVRMGEFSWSELEPCSGTFEFEWLDKVIKTLGKSGIHTIIGTPTAAPPAWLVEQYPEILPMDENGMRKGFGGRHHDCQSNKDYRRYVKRMVKALARHYKGNEYVIGWQIDNELGNSHEQLCLCSSCRRAFQEWLQIRYGEIKQLNKAWGTVFWSQGYNEFSQIPTPLKTPTQHSPSLLLDWKRFCSDLVVDFARMQIRIIREICPNHFITHNFMGIHPKTDYFKLAEAMDFVSNDQYPTGYYYDKPLPPYELAAYLDFMRGLKQRNFWMMEQQSGATGGAIIGKMPEPGQLRLWALQSIAHGADTVIFFRWRTCTFGAEQYWHGILPHHGVPGRRYRELKEMIGQISGIMEDIQAVVTRSEAAILYDYDQQWAFQIQPLHPRLSYVSQVLKYYEGFYKEGIPLDFTGCDSEWEGYRVIVAPLSLITDEKRSRKLKKYVEEGGTLLLTMRSGVKDENNVCLPEEPLPGPFRELTGIRIEDYDCLLYEEQCAVLWTEQEAEEVRGCKWMDVIQTEKADVLAEFASGYYRKSPAVTCHSFGKGRVYYVGTEPEQDLMQRIICHIRTNTGIRSFAGMDDGVELVLREGRNKNYLFALNHSGLPREFLWQDKAGKQVLQPYEGKVYVMEK